MDRAVALGRTSVHNLAVGVLPLQVSTGYVEAKAATATDDGPPSPLPPSPPHVTGTKRRRDTTSRWQERALDEYDNAVRVARRDGVT